MVPSEAQIALNDSMIASTGPSPKRALFVWNTSVMRVWSSRRSVENKFNVLFALWLWLLIT